MALRPFQKPGDREPDDERSRIFRGIYEENRSIQDFQGAHRRKAFGSRLRRFQRWIPAIALLIVLAGLGIPALMRQGGEVSPAVNADAPATASAAPRSAPVVTPDEQVANIGEIKSLEIRDDIPLSRMLNLGIRCIVIDAGHGGSNLGTVGSDGTMEKDITLAIALKLRDKLTKLGIADIRMTRTDDRTISLQERMDFAKKAKADMFVSIHVNSLPNSSANVIETFYFGPAYDHRTLQLADQENMGSEYGLSDFMEIVERLGKTMKLQESKKLAEAIQKRLYQNGKELDSDAINTGVKRAPFVVLMGLDVPSVLAEIACMSNAKAERDLKLAENQDSIAAALAAGVMSYQNRRALKNEER